jgi:hypothetical protein
MNINEEQLTNPQKHALERYLKEGSKITGVSVFVELKGCFFEILPFGDAIPTDIDVIEINRHFNKGRA